MQLSSRHNARLWNYATRKRYFSKGLGPRERRKGKRRRGKERKRKRGGGGEKKKERRISLQEQGRRLVLAAKA